VFRVGAVPSILYLIRERAEQLRPVRMPGAGLHLPLVTAAAIAGAFCSGSPDALSGLRPSKTSQRVI
jgi:hypothetical protein